MLILEVRGVRSDRPTWCVPFAVPCSRRDAELASFPAWNDEHARRFQEDVGGRTPQRTGLCYAFVLSQLFLLGSSS